MSAIEHKTITSPVELKNAATGEIAAVFSTFNKVDRDNDITLPSAFTNGQEVVMCWAHQWDKIIGRGKVRVEPTRAVFDGHLFMNTAAGKEAHETLKSLTGLAEYSWGFRIQKHDYQTVNGKRVRRILKAEVLEVSPVMKGAAGTGNSYTLALKQADRNEIEQLHVDHLKILARLNGTDDGIDADALLADHLAIAARRNGVRV